MDCNFSSSLTSSRGGAGSCWSSSPPAPRPSWPSWSFHEAQDNRENCPLPAGDHEIGQLEDLAPIISKKKWKNLTIKGFVCLFVCPSITSCRDGRTCIFPLMKLKTWLNFFSSGSFPLLECGAILDPCSQIFLPVPWKWSIFHFYSFDNKIIFPERKQDQNFKNELKCASNM